MVERALQMGCLKWENHRLLGQLAVASAAAGLVAKSPADQATGYNSSAGGAGPIHRVNRGRGWPPARFARADAQHFAIFEYAQKLGS
jgi:hypothetical protein